MTSSQSRSTPHLVTVPDVQRTHAIIRVIEVGCSGYGVFPVAEVAKAYSYIDSTDEWFSL